MIINTDQIKVLLGSDVPAVQIADETGLKPRNIQNYRKGAADFENMSLTYLAGLQKFYNDHKNREEDKKMENIKITGIRNAVGEFNKWQGAARVYFDPSDMSVWTNVYSGPGEEDRYDDPAITQIAQKATNRMDERDGRITMRQIREAVAAALASKTK
jgi:hypothetical protein